MTSTGIFPLITTAGSDFSLTTAATYTGAAATGFAGVSSFTVQVKFGYGSGGGSGSYYLQTSLDQGNTWIDIAANNFTTASLTDLWNFRADASIGPVNPSDGSMTAGTKQDGVLGDRLRLKIITASTAYVNTTVAVRICAR